jgi:hypothetical protein
MLLIEARLTLLSLLIAIVAPSLGARWFEKLELPFSRLSRRRILSITGVGVTALVLPTSSAANGGPFRNPPSRRVQLFFSCPIVRSQIGCESQHPMWSHFEATYVGQKPTYVSKFSSTVRATCNRPVRLRPPDSATHVALSGQI